MPTKKVIRFKVFLVDFADVRAPSGFNRTFVRDILFSNDPPSQTPDSNADPLEGSAAQFFFANTDGWLRTQGDVINWANSRFNSADIPHWNGSAMTKPDSTSRQVDFGESWPVIVAEALRRNNLVSSRFPSADALRNAILALPDGSTADRLVFLHTDVAGGGVRRSFGALNQVLSLMSQSNVKNNTQPGSNQPWSALWDPGWAGLPDFLATPILSANLGNIRSDGTYPAPSGTPMQRMEGFSIVLHEFGHLALDLPDFYTNRYGPWGNMCLMGGPRSETHFHAPLSSLALHKAGYLRFQERSRSDHRLRLRPYDSNRDAYRFTNGAPGSQEYLVVSARKDLRYKRFTAPDDQGVGVLAYRWDPHRRTRTVSGGAMVRKESSVVRAANAANNDNVLWKPGETIGATPPSGGVFEGPRTLRNSRGELWFTLDNIAQDGPDLIADFRLRALHLLSDFHRASWTGKAPGQTPVALQPDRFGGPDGHVILQDQIQPVEGRSGRGLYLHPRWSANGSIEGRYPLDGLEDGPLTLYAKVGMADAATGSDGVRLHFNSGSDRHSIRVEPGEYKQICIDFANPGRELEVIAEAGDTATRDWAYIIDGWLTPDAPRAFDFLANVDSAEWRTGSGVIAVNAAGSNRGEVSTRSWRKLLNGVVYFGRTAFTHPNWSSNGWVRGVYDSVDVPADGAFLRGALGWASGRRVTTNGADLTVRWRTSAGPGTANGQWQTLLDRAQYDLSSATSTGPSNDLMYLELPMPSASWGKSVDFQFQIDADGSAAQDWISWVKLALTTA